MSTEQFLYIAMLLSIFSPPTDQHGVGELLNKVCHFTIGFCIAFFEFQKAIFLAGVFPFQDDPIFM